MPSCLLLCVSTCGYMCYICFIQRVAEFRTGERFPVPYKWFWTKINEYLIPISSHLHILRIVSTGFEFTFNLIHVRSYSWARWFNFRTRTTVASRTCTGGRVVFLLLLSLCCVCTFISFWIFLAQGTQRRARQNCDLRHYLNISSETLKNSRINLERYLREWVFRR